MKKLSLSLIFILYVIAVCSAQNTGLLIDDFEGAINGGPDGTVDFGAGNGSQVEVIAASDIKYSGKQSLKVTYEAVAGGYMWVARGFDLDAKDAVWLVKPEDIQWQDYQAISFYLYGSGSKTQIAFDIKDSGNEMWRFIVEDNSRGFRQIICPFGEFFVRTDWQPDNSDKNGNLDFPIKIFQFEPLPEAKGVVYFDKVELIRK